MNRLHLLTVSLGLAIASTTGCSSGASPAPDASDECAAASDGTVCGAAVGDGLGRICVAHVCVVAKCGDGFANAAAGEACDDGNETPADGCEPVTCAYSCTNDAACDDANPCNGAETCNSAMHACVPGTSMVCTPSDACHTSTCAAASGNCVEALIDVDQDLHAPSSLGACGDDCDDTDAEIYLGHAEICGDGKDNNCVAGTSDEAVLDWYADCDQDGYAPASATKLTQCTMPATDGATTGCGAGPAGTYAWTNRAPDAQNTTDCSDASAEAHPDDPANPNDNVTFHTGQVPGTGGYDWNCDLVLEKGLTTAGVNASCMRCPNLCLTCQTGWQAATAPACGATNQPWNEGANCFTASMSCTATTKDQTCR